MLSKAKQYCKFVFIYHQTEFENIYTSLSKMWIILLSIE